MFFIFWYDASYQINNFSMRKGEDKHHWEKELTGLCKALLTMKTVTECKHFLRDICTITEMRAITERWQVAQMIDEKIPYRKIAEQTGVSTATITRVGRWLTHGENGYKTAIRRLKKG